MHDFHAAESPEDLRFKDPRQEHIYERLERLVGPGPAAFWRDACRLLNQEHPFESATHQIAHLLREIESSLRDVLEPVAVAATTWPEKEKGRNDRQKAEIRAVLEALGVADDDALKNAWLSLAGNEEGALHRQAHRDSLAGPRPLDQAFREWFDRATTVLDVVLLKLEERFGVYKLIIDGIAGKGCPSSRDMATLSGKLPNSLIVQGYLFSKELGPAWLAHLRANKFFNCPPPPIHLEGGIRTYAWPASRYLARMAKTASEEVMSTIMEVPYNENMLVHRNFAEAALAENMPARLVATWARQEADWIKRQEALYLGLPMDLGKVVTRLANEGEGEAALALADALLDITPKHGATQGTPQGRPGKAKEDPSARFDMWEYEQILAKTTFPLIEAADEHALNMFCNLLEKALRPTRRENEAPPQDYSYVWRPAVEDNSQNLNLDLKPILVTAVRDAAEKLAAEDRIPTKQLVTTLEERGKEWLIFQRIALHLLRKFPDAGMIPQRLTDRKLFEEVGARHEYTLLLSDNFSKLTAEEKEAILVWVERGRDYPDRKTIEERAGRKVTDEEIEAAKKDWQCSRLEPIKGSLQGKWRNFYESLTRAVGAPAHPEFPVYTTGGASAPASPKSPTELSEMPTEQLAEYLRTWTPTAPDPIHGPTIAGLSNQLTALVRANPEKYAHELDLLHIPEPTYARGILWGFEQALTESPKFDWEKVLAFCAWAVRQKPETNADEVKPVQLLDRDSNWNDAAKTVLRLISGGLEQNKQHPIPFSLRKAVWEALEPVTRAPDPSQEEENRYLRGGLTDKYAKSGLNTRSQDVMTLSISTVRGEAMHSVVRYALWVQQNMEKGPDDSGPSKQGFDPMPEVRRVLDERLDPTKEPSMAVRCVYGRALLWLHKIDKEWVQQAVPKMFPSDPASENLWQAAWEGYIANWPAYIWMYPLLREQYRRAIQMIGNWPEKLQRVAHLDEQLARHLMALNWLGTLDKEPEILESFYQKAGDELRAQAMNFVGWTLYNEKEPINPETLIRFIRFWEGRLREAQKSDNRRLDHAKEMAQFGWWFASGKFEDAWAMRQLEEALKIARQVVPDHLVFPRLTDLSQTMPLEAITCLALIVEGDKEGYGVLGWADNAKAIIKSAHESASEGARAKSVAIANRLASLGHFQFIEIIK